MSLDQSCTESPDRPLQQVAGVEPTVIAETIPAEADLKTNPLAVGLPPAHAARLRFFQPSPRPQLLTGEWQENCFGRLRGQGRLDQCHADFHDAIVISATESHVGGDGRLRLWVDPAEVGRAMPGRQYTHEQLDVLLHEIMHALAKWKSCRRIGLSVCESLFNRFEEVPQRKNTRVLLEVVTGPLPKEPSCQPSTPLPRPDLRGTAFPTPNNCRGWALDHFRAE